MKRSSIFAGLVAIVLVLSIAAGGFRWFSHSGQKDLPEQDSAMATPTAARFVPKTATAMLSLLVNPQQFTRLGESNGDKYLTYLDQIKSSLLAVSGLDYQKYIAPWVLDDITLAITSEDIDRDSENGSQPGYLLVTRTKDGRQARELLELFWQRQGVEGKDIAFASYNGIEIISCSQPLDIATAVVGAKFVLFANYPKVLRDAINNFQVAERNITNLANFQAVDLTDTTIGLLYLNLPGSQHSQGVYDSLAIALKASKQGLLASTTLFAPVNQKLTVTGPAFSQLVEALQYIPETTVVVASSKDLAQLYSQLQRGIAGYESLENLVGQSIADLQTRWDIDLPAEVFEAVRGEYAAGLWPRPDGRAIDGIFVAEKSQGDTPKLMARLESIARQQGYNIRELQVGDRPVSAWIKLPETAEVTAEDEDLNEQAIGVSATVGKYEIFATSLEAMEAAIKAPEAGSILTASNFQESIAPLAESNDGYLYLDWVDGKEIWERQVPLLRLAEIIGKPLFENLRSLTVSSYGSEVGERKADIFFRLGT